MERTSRRRVERLGTECVTSLETVDLSEGRALRMIAGPLEHKRRTFFYFSPFSVLSAPWIRNVLGKCVVVRVVLHLLLK